VKTLQGATDSLDTPDLRTLVRDLVGHCLAANPIHRGAK
jgi:hypothetical protein